MINHSGIENFKDRFKHHYWGLKLTKLKLVETLFSINSVKECLIPATNSGLQDNPLEYEEFLDFLGIWLQVSTTVGFDRSDFWSRSKVDYCDTIFKFNGIMSKHRFESIF